MIVFASISKSFFQSVLPIDRNQLNPAYSECKYVLLVSKHKDLMNNSTCYFLVYFFSPGDCSS